MILKVNSPIATLSQRAHMQEYAELKHGVSDSLLALGAVVGTSPITPKELSRLEKSQSMRS